jgi:ABC-type branched-subunit amino acid transport system ATPase component
VTARGSGGIGTDNPGGATLRAVGITKSFLGVTALDDVDLTLAPGQAIGLLGPNGSGKTTLINCLSGVLAPTAGEILLNERPISRLSRPDRAHLGLVRTYQNLRLFPALSVAENIEAGMAGARPALSAGERHARLADALAQHGLGRFAHQPVGTLPYGLQKRTEIARALVARPKILLLDEPAAGLGSEDWASLAHSLEAAQAAAGFGMLLVDHNVTFVTLLVDWLIVLANGKVIRAGEPPAVMGDAEVARVYLGDLARAAP